MIFASIMRILGTFLVVLFLGACGTRTSLTLPPRQTPAGATQAAPQSPPADDSKAGGAAAR
jgi:predicted small lipoprotein YifL